MTEKRPIELPSKDTIKEWYRECDGVYFEPFGYAEYIAKRTLEWHRTWHEMEIQAAADAELEACYLWTAENFGEGPGANLLQFRRPKPPTLKEVALADLTRAYNADQIDDTTYENIYRVLKDSND